MRVISEIFLKNGKSIFKSDALICKTEKRSDDKEIQRSYPKKQQKEYGEHWRKSY